jgi:hypothetical protein
MSGGFLYQEWHSPTQLQFSLSGSISQLFHDPAMIPEGSWQSGISPSLSEKEDLLFRSTGRKDIHER